MPSSCPQDHGALVWYMPNAIEHGSPGSGLIGRTTGFGAGGNAGSGAGMAAEAGVALEEAEECGVAAGRRLRPEFAARTRREARGDARRCLVGLRTNTDTAMQKTRVPASAARGPFLMGGSNPSPAGSLAVRHAELRRALIAATINKREEDVMVRVLTFSL